MTGRALVTGAAGFVGTTLCDHLEQQGWDVVRVVQTGQAGGIETDITDSALVDGILANAGKLTHVFHLAAIAFVPAANNDPTLAFTVNLNGTIHVAEAMRRHCSGARLVFVSTSDAYGEPLETPVTEEHPLNPVNVYSITKAAGDHYCAYLHRALGMDVVRVRPFNMSGPKQEPVFFLPTCAQQIARIELGAQAPVIRVGNLAAARDFSHVDDVVRAFAAAALRGRAGEAYNICSGVSHTMQAALDAMLSRSTAQITAEIDPDRLRPVDVPELRGSNEKLRGETGWSPEKNFDELIDDLLAYWRRRVAAEFGGK